MNNSRILYISTMIITNIFVNTCNNETVFIKNSLGSVADMDSTKYKEGYYIKYVDTFFKYYPAYKKPARVVGSG